MLTTGRIVRHTLVTPLAGESILRPRIGHDTLSPVDDSTATCCCGACCLVLCTLFGELTPKIADPRPHIKYGSLAPTRVHNPNGIWIGTAVLVGFIAVSNRQTDHARSVATGRIFSLHACDAAYNNTSFSSQSQRSVHPLAGDWGGAVPTLLTRKV